MTNTARALGGLAWTRSGTALQRSGGGIALVVGVAAALAWLPYSSHAGLAGDDYRWVAEYGGLRAGDLVSYRPGELLWRVLSVTAFGGSPHRLYLAANLLYAACCASLAVALRRLGAPAAAAGFAGLFLAVSPVADDWRLWGSAAVMSVAVLLALWSVGVGAGWVASGDRSRTRLLLSLGLFAGAVMTYELVAPLALLAPAMVALSPNRRRTWVKLGLDVAVAVPLLIGILLASNWGGSQPGRPLATYPGRVLDLVVQGAHVLGTIAGSAVTPQRLAVGVVAAVILTAFASFRGARTGPRAPETTTRRALLISAVALALGIFAGWMPLIPATDWYRPSGQGDFVNRVNAVALVFVAAFLAVAGALVARAGREGIPRAAGPGLCALVGAALLAGGMHDSLSDAGAYLEAAGARRDVLAAVHASTSRPPRRTRVLVGDFRVYAAHGVDVFNAPWDLNAAVRLEFADGSLVAVPLLPGSRCEVEGIRDHWDTLQPYSTAAIVDADRAVSIPIHDLSSCIALLPAALARY